MIRNKKVGWNLYPIRLKYLRVKFYATLEFFDQISGETFVRLRNWTMAFWKLMLRFNNAISNVGSWSQFHKTFFWSKIYARFGIYYSILPQLSNRLSYASFRVKSTLSMLGCTLLNIRVATPTFRYKVEYNWSQTSTWKSC